VLSDRLALSCDHPSCPSELVSGALEFHGSEADVERLKSRATAIGWTCLPVRIPADEGPVVGPWHYCPEHRPGEG
jgi:hypothetical protein